MSESALHTSVSEVPAPQPQPEAASTATVSDLFLQDVYSKLQPLNTTDVSAFRSYASTMQEVQTELKSKKPNDKQIDGQLSQAVSQADQIDRSTVQADEKTVTQALKSATNPTDKKQLQEMSDLYDSMLQASAQSRIAEGDLDLSQKDYSPAKSLFEAAQKDDPTYANSKQVDVSKLIGEAHAPSFWDKLEGIGKDVLTGAVTVGASVLGAAVGTVLEPGGGTVLGAALGAAVGGSLGFTGAELAEGKNISWYTPLEGAGLGVLSAVPIIGQGADAAASTAGAAGADAATTDLVSTVADAGTNAAAQSVEGAAADEAETSLLQSARGLVSKYVTRGVSIPQRVVRHVASSIAISTTGAASSGGVSAADAEAATIAGTASDGANNLAAYEGSVSSDTGASPLQRLENYFRPTPAIDTFMQNETGQLGNADQILQTDPAAAEGALVQPTSITLPTSEIPATNEASILTFSNPYLEATTPQSLMPVSDVALPQPPASSGSYGQNLDFSGQ